MSEQRSGEPSRGPVVELFAVLDAHGIAKNDHLGYLAGILVGSLRAQGFNKAGARAEFDRALSLAFPEKR